MDEENERSSSGFHRHDEIRRYREEFESGKFGEHKVPSFDQTFVWFQDKEAIAKRIVQVPMEEVSNERSSIQDREID